jgi:2C-methyl-D-erythritol 2,4-cyclodiphosphate synthase
LRKIPVERRKISRAERRDVLDTALCDKVFKLLATGQVGGFFPGTLVSSTNKTDRHDITEILLKVALNSITLVPSNASNGE